MENLLYGETLYYVGLTIMGAAVAGGVISAVIQIIVGKKLKRELDAEFGEKQR